MPVPSKLNSAEHLMVLPVPMRVTDGGKTILFESQACNGLERWCDSFESLYVAAPVLDESLVANRKSMSWMDVRNIPSIDRIEFVPLPMAYTMAAHNRVAGDVRATLRELINRSKYLHFGAFSLFGGWGGIAADLAKDMGRKYAVHFDYVEHEVMRANAKHKSLPRRLKAQWAAHATKRWLSPIIARASLVLCHGSDTYEYYKKLDPQRPADPQHPHHRRRPGDAGTGAGEGRIAERRVATDPHRVRRSNLNGKSAARLGPRDGRRDEDAGCRHPRNLAGRRSDAGGI